MTSARIAMIAVATMMLFSAVGADAAKRCRMLCREQVRGCIAAAKSQNVCTALHGHERRDCQRTLHTAVRTCKSMRGPILATCKVSPNPDACSPSGAFLDDVAVGS